MSERRPHFLEADDSAREQNLRIVRNPDEDIQQFFGGAGLTAPQLDYKVVTPKPGFCIKTYKVNVNEKFFINLCQSDEIPAPKDVTEEELAKILESEDVGSFRVPMSISDPRVTKDKSNNPVDVSDIAVNPKFFVKCQKSSLFKEFFLAIVSEALNEKYNIQLSVDKAIVLNHRKFIGTLVPHRIRNSDVKSALKNNSGTKDYLTLPEKDTNSSRKTTNCLVQEISEKEVNEIKKSGASKTKEDDFENPFCPEYKLLAKLHQEHVTEIQAEFYLPKCASSGEMTLDIGEDRILLQSMKHCYYFEKFVNYRMKEDLAKAIFDKANKMLQVRIPIYPVSVANALK